MSYCRIGRLGNSSIIFNEPRLVLNINGGLQPSGKQITKTFRHSNLVIGSFVFFRQCGFFIEKVDLQRAVCLLRHCGLDPQSPKTKQTRQFRRLRVKPAMTKR